MYTTVKAALQTDNPAYRIYFSNHSEKMDNFCAIVAMKEHNKNVKDAV